MVPVIGQWDFSEGRKGMNCQETAIYLFIFTKAAGQIIGVYPAWAS